MYKYMLNSVVKISVMFAKYFEYYTIMLRGAVFLWTRCRYMTCQSNSSKGCGHHHLLKWDPKDGEMLISQQVTSCLTSHSKLCKSRQLNNQSRQISIYRLQGCYVNVWKLPNYRYVPLIND